MVHFVDNTPFDFETEQRFSPVYNTALQQRTLFIPGGGCKFWLQTRGQGCQFCGFPGLTRLVVMGEGHESNYEGWLLEAQIFARMYDMAIAAPGPVDKFAIFNGGSFFVDSEVPAAARAHMLSDLATRPGLRQVMVESRPEYLTREILRDAKARLGDKDLMIGIGLESANDRVRNKYLRKGMTRAMFETALEMMRAEGVQAFTYVFLKAPGLSEAEAIDDAIGTLDYLDDLGVDEMALSCAFVPPGTGLQAEYEAGTFRPPWLRSVDHVLNYAIQNHMPLSLGGFDDKPTPVAIAHNCDHCSEPSLAALDSYRKRGVVEPQTPCGCVQDWTREIASAGQIGHRRPNLSVV